MKSFVICCAVTVMGASIFTSTTALAGPCTTLGGYLASPSRKVVEKSAEYSAQRNFDAFKSLLETGQAFILKAGLEVSIADRGYGLVKIRPNGKSTEVWTQSEAVSCR